MHALSKTLTGARVWDFAAIVSASRFSGLCALKVPLRNNCSEEGGPNEPHPLPPFLHCSSQNSVFGKVVFGLDMNSLTRKVCTMRPKSPKFKLRARHSSHFCQ